MEYKWSECFYDLCVDLANDYPTDIAECSKCPL